MSLNRPVEMAPVIDKTEEDTGERTCWICYENESESDRNDWRSPCRCVGSARWVHQSCLLRFVDERRRLDPQQEVCCQLCRFHYHIITPANNTFTHLYLLMQKALKLRPFPIATTSLTIGFYFLASSFGFFTILQCLGLNATYALLRQWSRLNIIFLPPSITIGLFLFHALRWEDLVIQLVFDSHQIKHRWFQAVSRYLWGSRKNIIDSTFVFPIVAKVLGKAVFAFISDPVRQMIYGGLLFTGCKGTLYIIRELIFLYSIRSTRLLKQRPTIGME